MEIRDKNGLTEQEFLKVYAQKNYPKPALTADLVIFSENIDAVSWPLGISWRIC